LPRISSSDPKLDTSALLGVLEPVLNEHGVEAVEVSFQPERQGWVMRVSIEDPKVSAPGAGVTLDVCAQVSRGFSRALDELPDLIEQAYHLEVGTPGVERPLFDVGDYARFVGQPAKVVLATALPDGQRSLRGRIAAVGAGAGTVTFEVEGDRVEVPAADIKSGHLLFEFGASAGKPREAKSKSGKRPKSESSAGGRGAEGGAGAGEGDKSNERRGEKRARASGSE
jgi:ribosome maturation factor RimP